MKTLSLTSADCAELNKAIAPQRGVPLGGGVHVTIPDDWLDRIMRGEKVPGCRYFEPSPDGVVIIADEVEPVLSAAKVAKVDAILAKPEAVLADPVMDPLVEEVVK